MMNKRSFLLLTPLATTIYNLMLVYVVYFLARILYLLLNYSYFAVDMTYGHLIELFMGGLVFDTSAILITNSLYIFLMLLPWHGKETRLYQQVCKWVFLCINGLALFVNCCDAVYFRFTMRRTTTTIFSEFSNEGNILSIFFKELVNHFYLVFIFGVIIWALYKFYRSTRLRQRHYVWWQYDVAMLLSLLFVAPFTVAGIRGGFTTAVRPITISNANQYADHPIEAALVLNTPFSLYRTIGKDVFVVPDYFNPEDLEVIYSPIHQPDIVTNDSVDSDSVDSDTTFVKKNVVILIVESFGREYIGALNRSLDGGRYKGYTPFVDSLIAHSVTFTHSYCNGRKSIDGMPSILSSIPMFVEPFFLTPASMNHVSGIARLLGNEGYETAFFHGAQRGSMGFQAFANATGFKAYYGREDFNADSRFGNDDDFDGTWAIWDEPFLQYYGAKMSEMKEPFMTAVFTASSHHPYVVPEKYQDVYPEEGLIIHKCIRYTDMAIRKFFERVSHEPWFHNTIFVLTSDHTNLSDHAYYQTDLGGFCSPIIIYEPGNQSRIPEIQDKIAQQIDILPTVMGMLHYPRPYFAFGIDLFNTPPEETWAVNYLNGIYQYVKKEHVLQFDGEKTIGIYALSDSLMQNNLNGQLPDQPWMEQDLKAIIQQYMSRMVEDRLMP
jgi:phosphoglycerol transferase MdoB-like AlkP superfamily enzyme